MKVFGKSNCLTWICIAILACLILGLGWWAALWRADSTEFRLRNELLQQAVEISLTIDPQLARQLTFTLDDKSNPAFEQIRQQLIAYRRLKPQLPIYSMALVEGSIVFGPESHLELENTNNSSRSGIVYSNPDPGIFEAFEEKRAIIVGPYTDEYSTSISALSPVFDPKSGDVLMVVGVDMMAEQWFSEINEAKKSPITATAILLVILVIGSVMIWYRDKFKLTERYKLQHLETFIAASVCLILTGYATYVAFELSENTRKENFYKYSQARAQAIRDAFQEADINIDALGRLYEYNNEISRESFRRFTEPMTKSAAIGAYQWIPVVPFEKKQAIEDTVRSEGINDFMIWQSGSGGEKVDVGKKVAYYPVLYIEPLEENLSVFGYDVGSQIALATAVEKAGKTGLKTATDPIAALGSNGKNTVVFRPVFRSSGDPGSKRRTRIPIGYVGAVLKIQKMLESNMRSNVSQAALVHTDMLDVMSHRPTVVASSNDEGQVKDKMWNRRDYELYQVTPVFAFDRTFAIISHPTDVFYAQNPPITSFIVAFTGFIITAVLTLFIKFLRSRHVVLEDQVRQRTEEIREREQRLSITLNSIGDAVITTDTDGLIIRMNPIAEKLTGWSFEEARNIPLKEVFKIYHATTLRPVQDPVSKVLQTGQLIGHVNHTTLFARHGTRYQIGHNASPIRDPSGNIEGVVLVFRDVTEQYDMQKTIEESEAQYRTLANSGQALVWTSGLNKKCNYFNEPWLRFTGKELEEQLGDGWVQAIHPEDLENRLTVYEEAFNSRKKFTVDYRLRRYDGKYRWIQDSGTPRFDSHGKFIGFIGHCLDITARKIAEENLEKSERRLMLATKGAGIGIWDYDIANDRLEWNDQMFEIYGITPGKFKNRLEDWKKLVVADDLDNALHVFAKALRGECEFNTEFHILRPDKSIRCVKGIAGVTWDQNGNATRVIGVNYDTTELEKAYAELKKALEVAEKMAVEAQAANIAKGQFLANISHEIRTPMNGVIGMTDLLLETELTEEQQRYAEIVRSSGNSMLSLINEILDFSKIEADKLELEVLDFDLRELVEETAEMLAFRAQEKDVELIFRIDPELHTKLRSDFGRIKQILTNLGGNAIKFTEKGEISINVSKIKESGDKIKLKFEVKDTGIGIPKDKLTLLFNPFQQVDDSHTRRFSGTGLGLAISKRLAEMLGGEIGVLSEPGKGSTFWFTAECEKQPGVKSTGNECLADINNVKILIIDDNISNCKVLGEQLTIWGAICEYCHKEMDAVDVMLRAKADGSPFQIVIIDLQMPYIDGCSIGKVIKKNPAFKDTSLIMMTVPGKTDGTIKINSDGFEGYLSKPIKQSSLNECLSKILGYAPKSQGNVQKVSFTSSLQLSPQRRKQIRILLAEDNPINQKVAIGMLKKLGLSTDAVVNGRDAVDALSRNYYDLVFMDIQMPVMDGLAATDAIRNSSTDNPTKPDVPIIAMTANAIKGDREKCIQAGMDDYIPKPVMLPVLAEMLNKWLCKSHAG